jgi:hypothetical protein
VILDLNIKQKRIFSVKSKEDMRIAKKFFKTWSWGGNGCPFVLEQPYICIPDMMKEKIINGMFKITIGE